MTVMTVSVLMMNQTDSHLVHNENENCQCGHIPLNLKIIRNLFIYVCRNVIMNMQLYRNIQIYIYACVYINIYIDMKYDGIHNLAS